MNLKPYPEYKDSGVSWLSKIPAGWRFHRAKHVFNSIDIRSKTGNEELLSVSEKKGVTPRKQVNVTMFKAESYLGYKLCWPGDLVINSLWAWMQGLGFSKYHGIISSAYGVYRLKTKENDFKYLDYLLRSKIYLWELRVNSKGIWRSRYQLTDESFLGIPFILPTLTEQTQIARFLDWKTVQIAKFIKSKKRMIEFLKEQKQVIINDAVTGKIDVTTGKPYPKYKDSGVDWLGKIPEGWEVLPFTKYVTDKSDYRGATPEKVDNGIYLVTAKNIGLGFIDYNTSKEYVTREGYNKIMQRGLPKINDLLLTSEAPLGHAALVDREDVCLAQRIFRFRMNPCFFNNKFILFSVLSEYFQMQLLFRGTGSTAIGIKASKLPQLKIITPLLKEQATIISYIENKTSILDLAISRTEREISLMIEYRDRMIADVVTGKVDVRGIDVPEVAEEINLDDTEITDEEIDETDGETDNE